MASSLTLSGARSRFKVDGTVVGFASNVSGAESIDYEPIDVLDLLEVREFVPVAYRATLSAQAFRLVGNSLKAQGIFPAETNILTSGDLTCTLEDKITGETWSQWEGVKASEHSWDVAARGVVAEAINFVAIRVKDEFDVPAGG